MDTRNYLMRAEVIQLPCRNFNPLWVICSVFFKLQQAGLITRSALQAYSPINFGRLLISQTHGKVFQRHESKATDFKGKNYGM